MKVVIACDSFKGSVSASEAAACLECGIRRIYPDAVIDKVPIADGGEGMVESLLSVLPGEKRFVDVLDPLGRPIRAQYALLKNSTAVIETAAASGLPLLREEELNPLKASTYGTGQLMRAALDEGCTSILLGLGGSATNDAGAGMAQALGIRLLDSDGKEIPQGGGSLDRLVKIDTSQMDHRLLDVPIIAACDVTNPLCGVKGASSVYGPQKGADAQMVKQLDQNLNHFAQIGLQATGKDVRNIPGSGAAGGMGAGLLIFFNASLCSGIETLLDLIGFDTRILDADLVITGEGRIDGQSLCGKVPIGIAQRVKTRRNIPVIGIVGEIGQQSQAIFHHGIDSVFSITPGPVPLQDSMQQGAIFLADTAERVMRLIRAVKPLYTTADSM